MSIQVDQSVTNKITQTNAYARSQSRLVKFTEQFDTDTIVSYALILIIWGGFFVAFGSI